jgi:hypothetical protein
MIKMMSTVNSIADILVSTGYSLVDILVYILQHKHKLAEDLINRFDKVLGALSTCTTPTNS